MAALMPSIGDVTGAIRYLIQLVRAVKKDSAEEYADHVNLFRAYDSALNRLDRVLRAPGQASAPMDEQIRRASRLLHRFYSKIKPFRSRLSPRRARRSLLGVFDKVKWMFKRSSLNSLRGNIQEHMLILNTLMATATPQYVRKTNIQ